MVDEVTKPGDRKVVLHELSNRYRWETMLDDGSIVHGWEDLQAQANREIDLAQQRQHWQLRFVHPRGLWFRSERSSQ